jgi:hypothetical protein
MEETATYLPPIWLSTLAYSFSAPTAMITLGLELADAMLEGEVTRSNVETTRAPETAMLLATRHG